MWAHQCGIDKSIDISVSGAEESLEINQHIYVQLDLGKGSKVVIWGSKLFLISDVGKTGHSYYKMNFDIYLLPYIKINTK